MLGNSFLFNVVDDPLERANMKARRPDIFEDLVKKYEAWDRGMLLLDMESASSGFSGADLADHFGVLWRRIPHGLGCALSASRYDAVIIICSGGIFLVHTGRASCR